MRILFLSDNFPPEGYAPATRLYDPYYSGGFAEVYQLVEQGCRGLLEHIVERERLSV